MLTCVLVLNARGQVSLKTDEIPAAPESHILDEDRVFLGNEDLFNEISEDLLKLKKKYDFDFYVVVFKGLIGSDSYSQANIYQENWLGDKNDGLVAVFDLQSRRWLAWGMSQPLYTGAYDERGLRPRLEYFEVSEMITSLSDDLRKAAEKDDEKGESKATTVFGLTADSVGIVALAMSKKLDLSLSELGGQEGTGNGKIRMMGWVALALVVLGLLMLLLIKLFVRAEIKAKKTYEFPDVLVGERLGAIYGGGKSSSISFGSPSSSGR